MPDIDKNNIRVKVKNEKSLRKDYYIEIGESIGYGLNNGKQFDSEENLCKKLIYYFAKYHPKAYYIMIGDSLHRFNYHLMIQHLSDEELKERLKDLPDNMTEEKLVLYFADKFQDVAKKIGKKLADSLTDYFAKINDLPAPVIIKHWDERRTKKNYEEKITLDVPKDDEKMKKTKLRFLCNKKNARIKAENRMKTAQLKLAHYNFSIIDDLSCEKYVEEENDYFKHLQNTGFAYPTEAPPAIAPIFENNPNGLSWLQVTFKKQNKNKIKKQIAELEEKINDCKPTSGTSSTQINVMLSRTQSSSAIETHGKRAMHPTPLDTMSPRTAKRVMTFLNSYAKSPKSPEEKEQALKKLDEATSILSM